MAKEVRVKLSLKAFEKGRAIATQMKNQLKAATAEAKRVAKETTEIEKRERFVERGRQAGQRGLSGSGLSVDRLAPVAGRISLAQSLAGQAGAAVGGFASGGIRGLQGLLGFVGAIPGLQMAALVAGVAAFFLPMLEERDKKQRDELTASVLAEVDARIADMDLARRLREDPAFADAASEAAAFAFGQEERALAESGIVRGERYE